MRKDRECRGETIPAARRLGRFRKPHGRAGPEASRNLHRRERPYSSRSVLAGSMRAIRSVGATVAMRAMIASVDTTARIVAAS